VLREIGHPIILERIHNGKPLPLFNPEEYNNADAIKRIVERIRKSDLDTQGLTRQ
jgi:hypothetical protein